MKIKPTIIKKDAFSAQKNVSFFLRIHRHLPNGICGGLPLGNCFYREDGEPINSGNDYIEKLQRDPDFRKKEKELIGAVIRGEKLFNE